jgi:hypothetical protein
MFVLVVLTALSEIAALGLGLAGVLQRNRERVFAFVGVACSLLVLAAIHSRVGLVDLASLVAAGLTEDQPKVHIVSSGDE